MRALGNTLKVVAIILVAGGIILYALYQSSDLLRGPIITVTSPTDGATLLEPRVTVAGTATNITSLTLNGRSILVNEQGEFAEEILLLPGYNIVTLVAEDRFGRTEQQVFELVLQEETIDPYNIVLPEPPPASTTTLETDEGVQEQGQLPE